MTEATWNFCTQPLTMVIGIGRKIPGRKRWRMLAAALRYVADTTGAQKGIGALTEFLEEFADEPKPQVTGRIVRKLTNLGFHRFHPLHRAGMTALEGRLTDTISELLLALHVYQQRPNKWQAKIDVGLADVLREVVGNPFRPVSFPPNWRSETAVALATGIYAERAFDRLPILADALEDAGCDNADVLSHCRGPGPHARGCWVVDGVLGKV
jgi:hypothetical protein